MSNTNQKTNIIQIEVSLDNDQVPDKVHWTGDGEGKHEAKAFLLSIFDKETMDTLKIDLWTKDFQVNEMDRFMYNTMLSLGETYLRATHNRELAEKMASFAQHFAEETKLIDKEQ